MLSFDIRTLVAKAAMVDGHLAADDAVWMEGDTPPSGAGVHVSGRLSAAGDGRFYLSGRLDGSVDMECRRCLGPAKVDVAGELHVLFTEVGNEDEDDPDVYPISTRADTLDLRPAIREQWLLEVPSLALCTPDCKGLCPRCGADLNSGPCGCAAQ